MKPLLFLCFISLIACKKDVITIDFEYWEKSNRTDIENKTREFDKFNSEKATVLYLKLIKKREEYLSNKLNLILHDLDNGVDELYVFETFGKKHYNLVIRIKDSKNTFFFRVSETELKEYEKNIEDSSFEDMYGYICRDSLDRYINLEIVDMLEIYTELALKEGQFVAQKSCSYFIISE